MSIPVFTLYLMNVIINIISGISFLIECSSHYYVKVFNFSGNAELTYYGLYMHCILHAEDPSSDLCVDHTIARSDYIIDNKNLTLRQCCDFSRNLMTLSEFVTLMSVSSLAAASLPHFNNNNKKPRIPAFVAIMSASSSVFNCKTVRVYDKNANILTLHIVFIVVSYELFVSLKENSFYTGFYTSIACLLAYLATTTVLCLTSRTKCSQEPSVMPNNRTPPQEKTNESIF